MWLRASHVLLASVAALLSAAVSAEECPTKEIDYVMTGRLEIRDTPMGRGDGTYPIGPGRTVLRFEGSSVKMLAYTMHESFTIRKRTVFWTTTVTTTTDSAATPDACSVVAEGDVIGHTVRWRTPVRGYHTDGVLTCSGSFCGDFGVPPPGESQLHIPPAPQKLSDFVFSPDWKTFTMAKTPGVKTEMPKQSSAVSTSGREVRRTCVSPKPC